MSEKYIVSADVWGKIQTTVEAYSEDDALARGARVLRANWQDSFELFPPRDGLEVEATLSVDTEFEVEVSRVSDVLDPRIEAMARAFAQEIYGIDNLGGDPQIATAARRVARRMFDEAEKIDE